MSFHGSCLCGAIRFSVDEAMRPYGNCHWSMCRRATGAAFWTAVPTRSSAVHWLDESGSLRWFESSTDCFRGFCGVCGATLAMRDRAFPEALALSVAVLDEPPANRPAAHQFVDSKCTWLDLYDELESYPGPPPKDSVLDWSAA